MYLSRQEPLEPIVKKMTHKQWRQANGAKGGGDDVVYVLEWPSVEPLANNQIIEAARDEGGAEWFRIDAYYLTGTTCAIRQLLTGPSYPNIGSLHPYTGPLKFRVVPIRYSPP